MKIGQILTVVAAALLPQKTNEVEKKQMGDSGFSVDHLNQELYSKKADGTETVQKINYYDPFEEGQKVAPLKKEATKEQQSKPSVMIFGDDKASYMLDRQKSELTTVTSQATMKKEKVNYYDPFENAEKGKWQHKTSDGKPCDLEKEKFCYAEFVSESKAQRQI